MSVVILRIYILLYLIHPSHSYCTTQPEESNQPQQSEESEQSEQEDKNYEQKFISNLKKNLSKFDKGNISILYRGVHFLPAKFQYAESIKNFLNVDQTNIGLYSPATHELAGKDFYSQDVSALTEAGKNVAERINKLWDIRGVNIGEKIYRNARYAFQQLYSNDQEKFYRELSNPKKYIPVFKDNFISELGSNPLVSFSQLTNPAIKYGFGLKNFGQHEKLLPLYDCNGRPSNPKLGKLYVVALDEATVEELKPVNVYDAHNRDLLKIHSHWANNILSEREVAVPGYVPGECVISEFSLMVPSFEGKYTDDIHKKRYCLSKRRFNNNKRILTSRVATQQTKNDKARSIIEGIINPSFIDKGNLYKNALAYRIPKLVQQELKILDLQNVPIVEQYR